MSDDKIKMMGEPQNYGQSAEVSDSASLPCSTDGGPLTPSQRVDRLFDKNEFPTHKEIEIIIWDAEFDTLNCQETILKRHRQSRL